MHMLEVYAHITFAYTYTYAYSRVSFGLHFFYASLPPGDPKYHSHKHRADLSSIHRNSFCRIWSVSAPKSNDSNANMRYAHVRIYIQKCAQYILISANTSFVYICNIWMYICVRLIHYRVHVTIADTLLFCYMYIWQLRMRLCTLCIYFKNILLNTALSVPCCANVS